MLVLWPEDAIGVAMMNDSGSLNLEYTGTNRPTTTNAQRPTVSACMPARQHIPQPPAGNCEDWKIVSLERRRYFSIRLKSLEWSGRDGMNVARDGPWDSEFEEVTSKNRHLFTSV